MDPRYWRNRYNELFYYGSTLLIAFSVINAGLVIALVLALR
jgi:hypothetical protein